YHAERTLCPTHARKVASKDAVLAQSMVFDCFAQLHIIQNLQAERLVGSYLLVGTASNKVKRARSDMIPSAGVLHFPGTLPKREQSLDRAERHSLTESHGNERGKEHEMVCTSPLCISHCAAQRIGTKEDIAVSKQDPAAGRSLGCPPHGMGLAQPAW